MEQLRPFTLLDCPTCQRRGVVGNALNQVCPTCGGSGAAMYISGTWLIWGRRITQYAYLQERIQTILWRVLHLTLLFLAIAGFLWGGWTLGTLIAEDPAFATLLNARGIEAQAFWLSIIIGLFLYYRLTVDSQTEHRVVPMIDSVPPPSVPFADILRLSAEKKKDLAEGFSDAAMRAVERAKGRAAEMHHRWVEPVHILADIFDCTTVQTVLLRMNIKPDAIGPKVMRKLRSLSEGNWGEPFLSPASREVLFRAYAEASRRHARRVDPTDLLIAIEQVEKDVQDILYDLDVDARKLHNVVLWVQTQERLAERWKQYRRRARRKPKGTMNRAMTAVATPYLDRFSQDLTQAARIGALPICIGREREMNDIFRVMSTGARSIVLVGEPGVGRSTIVAGIAERMATEDVSSVLQDRRLIAISASAIVAGAAMGEVEGRVYRMLTDAARAGNIVLVVENVHDIIGVTSKQGEGVDLSEILATAIGPGLQVLCTTNPEDYRRFVEKGALGEKLTKIAVTEMDEDQTFLVLAAKVGRYESERETYFSYDALERIITLTKRYMADQSFPAKAINLLDEVSSYALQARGKKTMVTAEDVAQVVAQKRNVPVTQITQKESEKLLHLEEHIHTRIIGQDEAVKKVSAALRRARTELRDQKRPIATFMFLGPTGVGKTELAKTIADVYFGSERNMIRLDMSEYQEQSSIRRLIGAPPGSGDTGGGTLTEAIRAKPFSIILLDELEKAHSDILNVFLQVFDDGRLTDARGRTADFTNAIIVATSNAGSPVIQQRIRERATIEAITQELINTLLGQYYRPEFLNRFDGIIVFTPLSPDEILQITRLLLGQVAKLLEAKGIQLRATDEAVEEIALEGYDATFGARPLRRLIQERIDDALAKALLEGKIGRRDVAVLEPGGMIRIEKAQPL